MVPVAIVHSSALASLLVLEFQRAATAGVSEGSAVVLALRQRVELRAVVGAATKVGIISWRLVVRVRARAAAAAVAERYIAADRLVRQQRREANVVDCELLGVGKDANFAWPI